MDQLNKLIEIGDRLSSVTARDGIFALAIIAYVAAPLAVFSFYKSKLLQTTQRKDLQDKIQSDLSHYSRVSVWLGAFLVVCSAAYWCYTQIMDFNALAGQLSAVGRENASLKSQVNQRLPVVYGEIDSDDDSYLFSPLFMNDNVYMMPMQFDGRKVWVFAIILPDDKIKAVRIRYLCVPPRAGFVCPSQTEGAATIVLPSDRTEARKSYHFRFSPNGAILSALD